MKKLTFTPLTGNQIEKIKKCNPVCQSYKFFKTAKAAGFYEVVNKDGILPTRDTEWKKSRHVYTLWTNGDIIVYETKYEMEDLFCGYNIQHNEFSPGIVFWAPVTENNLWIMDFADEDKDMVEAINHFKQKSETNSPIDSLRISSFLNEVSNRIRNRRDVLDGLQWFNQMTGEWETSFSAPTVDEVVESADRFRYRPDLERLLENLPTPKIADDGEIWYGLIIDEIVTEGHEELGFQNIEDAEEWMMAVEDLMRMKTHQ